MRPGPDPTDTPAPTKTRRESLIDALRGHWRSPRELARDQRIRVSEIAGELEHVRRTLGRRLEHRPAECTGCGFSFDERTRTSTPSRCPRCKRERIDGPWFRVRDAEDDD